jgi:hypothetical protein
LVVGGLVYILLYLFNHAIRPRDGSFPCSLIASPQLKLIFLTPVHTMTVVDEIPVPRRLLLVSVPRTASNLLRMCTAILSGLCRLTKEQSKSSTFINSLVYSPTRRVAISFSLHSSELRRKANLPRPPQTGPMKMLKSSERASSPVQIPWRSGRRRPR